MRFRFCGDDQCPQWVLSEIEALSAMKLENVRILVGRIVAFCLEGSLEYDYDEISRLMSSKGEDVLFLKETMAAVHFIISTAAKHDVDDLSLIQEIQQLGLPQESAIVIGTVFMENKEALKARLRKETCRLSRVLRTDWHVESNALATDAETKCSIQLRILLDTEPMRGPLCTGPGSGSDADPANRTLSKTGEEHNRLKDLAFNITPEKLDLLILELTQAKSIMDGLIK